MSFCCLRRSCCFLVQLICKEGFVPLVRTTGSTCSCASSGTTHGWPTRSTQTTPWTWTPPCWTPFGNLTCSSPMKRGQTSTRSPQITNCCGYSRMGTFSTASGEGEAANHSGSLATFKIHFHSPLQQTAPHLMCCAVNPPPTNMFVSLQFSSLVTVSSHTH